MQALISMEWYRTIATVVFSVGLCLGTAQAQPVQPNEGGEQKEDRVTAQAHRGQQITLIHLHDTHGQFIPHWQPFQRPDEQRPRWQPNSGGWAKLYTKVEEIRQTANGNAILIINGDNFYGGVETLFTRGEGLIPIINEFKVDAYVPGNWDFANGPEAFRKLFVDTKEEPKSVNFPVLAMDLLEAEGVPGKAGKPVLTPYLVKTVNGVKVLIAGIVTDKVAEQGAIRAIGFDFIGSDAIPKDIFTQLRERENADVVVLATEAQLSQAVALARDYPGLDVVLGSDTHETLYDPIIPKENAAIVMEEGEGAWVGQLDLTLKNGRIVDYQHTLHEIDDEVVEHPRIRQRVEEARAPFLSGSDFKPQVRSLPGWPKDQGVALDEPMDTVIGRVDTDLERHHVLERVIDNFIADALLEMTGADIGISNGFRYDLPLKADQEITLEHMYRYLPLAGHIVVAEFTGGQLFDILEGFLGKVFHPNPHMRTGGWMPAVSGLRLKIDLSGPAGPALDRIQAIEVLNRHTSQWEPLQEDRVYTVASCYSPGDPLDEVCRVSGARNLKFLTQDLKLVPPLTGHQPSDLGSPTQVVQVAPLDAMFAVEMIREYVQRKGGVIRATNHGLGRLEIVKGELPVSVYSPMIVQPLQGAGPDWLVTPRIEGPLPSGGNTPSLSQPDAAD